MESSINNNSTFNNKQNKIYNNKNDQIEYSNKKVNNHNNHNNNNINQDNNSSTSSSNDNNNNSEENEDYSDYSNEEEDGIYNDGDEDSYEDEEYDDEQEYDDERYLDENDYNNSKDGYESKLTITQNQLVSKKQYSNISGKIFVGGLLKTTSNETLREYFTQFGIVKESIVIKATEKSNKSRGFGFVTFIEPSIIEKVIVLDHAIEGKRVEIRRAIPKEEMIDEPKKQKLFVGGLPKHITLEEFKSYFSDYGEVSEYNLLIEKNGAIKGFGFICFKDENVNHNVLADTHFILGKRVDVRVADNQNKRFQQAMNGSHYHHHNGGQHYQYPIVSHQKSNIFFLHQAQPHSYPPQTNQSHSSYAQQLTSPATNSSTSTNQSLLPSPQTHHNTSSSPQYSTSYNLSAQQQHQQYTSNNDNYNNKSPQVNNNKNNDNNNNNNNNNNTITSSNNNNGYNKNSSSNNNNAHQQHNQKHLINSPHQQQHSHNAISNYNQHPLQLHPIQIQSDSNGTYEFYSHAYEPFYASLSQHPNSSSSSNSTSSFYPGNVVMVPVIYPYPYQQDPHSSKYYQQSIYPYYNRYYPQSRSLNLLYPTQYESSQQISHNNQHTYRSPKSNNNHHNNNSHKNNNNNIDDNNQNNTQDDNQNNI